MQKCLVHPEHSDFSVMSGFQLVGCATAEPLEAEEEQWYGETALKGSLRG